MGFDNFRVNVTLRILLLLGLMFVLLWGLLNTGWQATPLVCLVLLLLLAVELVHYVETTNRQFSSFLDAIREHDFATHTALGGKGRSFEELATACTLITTEFQRLNSERELRQQLLAALVEHIRLALLCIDEQGELVFVNQAARDLFRSPHLHYTASLARVTPELPALLAAARDGERQLVNLRIGGELLPLSMATTRFHFMDKQYLLVSLQDIRIELERSEVDSWQKLIRVLTHEIMNSVTPIVSLTDVIRGTLLDDQAALRLSDLSDDERLDLVRSLQAIETRGKGLVRFVQTYNSLANPPAPAISSVQLAPLLEHLALLLKPALDHHGIALDLRCEPRSLGVLADPQQLEQVLINLVKNAREALAGRSDGLIRVHCGLHAERGVQIIVGDNGPGLDAQQLQLIFIPFYSTRKDGSGIGLSVSRQLVMANQGQLLVSTEPGKGCEFSVCLRPAPVPAGG